MNMMIRYKIVWRFHDILNSIPSLEPRQAMFAAHVEIRSDVMEELEEEEDWLT